MAHRYAGEPHAPITVNPTERKGRLAFIIIMSLPIREARRQLNDFCEHRAHLVGFLAIIQRGSDLDIESKFAQIGLQLIFDRSVEHDGLLFWQCGASRAPPE